MGEITTFVLQQLDGMIVQFSNLVTSLTSMDVPTINDMLQPVIGMDYKVLLPHIRLMTGKSCVAGGVKTIVQ